MKTPPGGPGGPPCSWSRCPARRSSSQSEPKVERLFINNSVSFPTLSTSLCVRQMARLGFLAAIFLITLYRGAGIRTQVSRVEPDWDL